MNSILTDNHFKTNHYRKGFHRMCLQHVSDLPNWECFHSQTQPQSYCLGLLKNIIRNTLMMVNVFEVIFYENKTFFFFTIQ